MSVCFFKRPLLAYFRKDSSLVGLFPDNYFLAAKNPSADTSLES